MTVPKEIRDQVYLDYLNGMRPAYIRQRNDVKKSTYYIIINEKKREEMEQARIDFGVADDVAEAIAEAAMNGMYIAYKLGDF